MNIQIKMQMSGNQLLDLLRKVPNETAQRLLDSSSELTTLGAMLEDEEKAKLFWQSAKEIISCKKR